MSIICIDFMIYFIMLVSNNSLLNILLPNENKVLKDVLKEADVKTSNNIKAGTTTVGDILKDLFNDLKTGDKSKTTIENLLKNSNLFKDLGNFSNSIKSLLTEIEGNDNLSKFKTQLENFQKDVSTLDNKALKDLISKSGVFLESKVLSQVETSTTLPKNLETILKEIKTLLKEIPSLDAKKIENLIDKIIQNNTNSTTNNSTQSSSLQNNNDLKTLLDLLQNLSKNVGDKQLGNLTLLTNNLKNISTQAQLLESKIANLDQGVNTSNLTQVKESLTNNAQQTLIELKNQLASSKNITNSSAIIKQIDNLLQSNDLFSKNQSLLEPKNLQQNILNQTTNLNSFQSNFSSNINTLLLTLKENIGNLSNSQNNLTYQQNIIKTVEKLETIVNNFMQNSLPNPQIGQERVLQQNNPLQNDMKNILLQMQEELVGKTDIKSADTLKQVDKMLMQVEYYQLLSMSSNSNSVYIPFFWDMLEDGSISMKKVEEEKFYCEINLSLKEFGQTQLLLALYDKNKLDLTIYASNNNFKESVKENVTKLKQALNSVDLIPVNIKIIDLKKEKEKPIEQPSDVYSQNNNLGFGINIKA